MLRRTFLATSAMAALAACGGTSDEILPGLRVAVNQPTGGATAAPTAMPAAQSNSAWTHRGGNAAHQIGHVALGADLHPLFSTSIGAGNDRRTRIVAQPVVADGRIFTMDARSAVTALSLSGQVLWRRDMVRGAARAEAASGGGMAVSGSRLFVTSGFGLLMALDVTTGAILWEQNLDAPAGASPTVAGSLLFIVGRDGRARALDVETGRQRWAIMGNSTEAGMVGGAGAAVSGTNVVFPFPSGELMATYPNGGATRWSSYVAGVRPGDAGAALLTDFAGDPVIAGNRVYAANVSGRVAAYETGTGTEVWGMREGATGPLALVGDALFFVNDQNMLVRLDARSGATVWRQQMPTFTTNWFGNRRGRFVHFGPVIAGGRAIIASSDGMLRQFDAATGALLSQVELASPAAAGPVVVGGVLYLLTADGTLRAFR
ncbi:pyrrolo-quinoline quinone [Ketogulonicigenium robustum]|uniref:Pyrrolo-quinoline quinone n=1 Tax=Ketogulonicigenium robustum TaxID=92947 RepID=A0A1W6NZW6_9RHOB|nr:PQQ-binding-like beta-propeller repeat protein [Ketogulonicigenium robustum]ARO14557.1 pyrrolo-quinoline quinone [Ketogulonicigenium robustum]